VVLEALMPPKGAQDPFLQDLTSFTSIEAFSMIPDLTPEEVQELMKDLRKPETSLEPTKPGDN
jgi:hypothetical protein